LIDTLLTCFYICTQALAILLFIHQVRAVAKSVTADAISVPAYCVFTMSAFASVLYTFIVVHDPVLTAVVTSYFIGNMIILYLAYFKQRKIQQQENV
jgi:uncharacterized protein with PQ loop repeat